MKTIKYIGPFASNYSFARVNRGLAKGISNITDEYKITFDLNEQQIDKLPDDKFIKENPYIEEMIKPDEKVSDFVIYNNFPKGGIIEHGMSDFPGRVKIAYLAWEESVYPEVWVKEINENLHALFVSATFVREIMRNAGVKIPIFVIPNAIDDEVRALSKTADYPLKTKKKVKFLNISTGRKRKGIDVLIKAYFKVFSKEDDVCLVIKSFPGADNTVNQILAELETESTPEVEHIMDPDLSEQELVNLIETCDVGVYPTRAEGFGLPIAESMYRGRAVIATNYSAYLDFANKENAYLIDYELTDATDSEMVNIGAKWAEPNLEDLSKHLRLLYEVKTEAADELEINRYNEIIKRAKSSANELSWDNSAKKVINLLPQIEEISKLKSKKAACISFLNNEDGIAIYTQNLFEPIEHSFQDFYYLSNIDIADRVSPDEANVVRLWQSGAKELDSTTNWLLENKIDLVHIQYHSGINFPPKTLNQLIVDLKKLNIEVYLTLHAVRGDGFDLGLELSNLGEATKVFIHHQGDAEYLAEKFDNIFHYPLPRIEFKYRNEDKIKKELGLESYYPIICTHGLFNQNKNIPIIIEAFNLIKAKHKNAFFMGLNALSSNNISAEGEYKKTLELVNNYNLEDSVLFITNFLSNEQVEILVQAADINVLAYKESGESASAAVDKFLASKHPTVVSRVKAFDVFDQEVIKSEPSAVHIAENIEKIINDKDLSLRLSNAATEFIASNNFEIRSFQLLKEYKL